MIVLCGFVPGSLRGPTVDKLWHADVPVRFADVSSSIFAYWEEIRGLWRTRDLVIVEQDIEIHDEVMSAFRNCPSLWCSFGYPLWKDGATFYYGIGCVRFRQGFMEAISPEEIQAAHAWDETCQGAPGCYMNIDMKIAVTAMLKGIEVCRHDPPVKHHQTWCDCGEC